MEALPAFAICVAVPCEQPISCVDFDGIDNRGYFYSSSTGKFDGLCSKKYTLEYFPAVGSNFRGGRVKSKKSSTKSADRTSVVPSCGRCQLSSTNRTMLPSSYRRCDT